MTKTEILKFCGNDIYPIHNGMKRNNQDVAYYLRGNRKFTNLNHQLFYSRQRGINCIPMHIYKKFLSVDLVGIEKGIITNSNVSYYDLGNLGNYFGNTRMFVYGQKPESKPLSCQSTAWGELVTNRMLNEIYNSIRYDVLIIEKFFYEKLSIRDNVISVPRNTDDSESKFLLLFAMFIPHTENNVTVDYPDAYELYCQASDRVESYKLYGGVSAIEMKRSFNMQFSRKISSEPSKLFYYYDMLRRRYDEEGI